MECNRNDDTTYQVITLESTDQAIFCDGSRKDQHELIPQAGRETYIGTIILVWVVHLERKRLSILQEASKQHCLPPTLMLEICALTADTNFSRRLFQHETGRWRLAVGVPGKERLHTSSLSFVASCSSRTSSCTSNENNGPDFPRALFTIKS